MINNTSLQRWERVAAKSIDIQFMNEMQQGLNCSPFEAQIMVDKVHELYGPLFDTSRTIKPGQVQTVVLDISVPPGARLRTAKQKLVTVTLQSERDDIEARRQGGVPALRQLRLGRVAEEAFQQGGVFTLEDLSLLFNCGVRTLVGDLDTLKQQGSVPPLRSTVKDIGRAITHRRQIVALWLDGKEYSDIAYKTRHTVSAVANYVDKFKRCAALSAGGFDLATIAFMTRISPVLAREFVNLYTIGQSVPHRQREIEGFLKKTPAGQPPKKTGRRP